MTPETSTENRERQPAFSAAGLLAAFVEESEWIEAECAAMEAKPETYHADDRVGLPYMRTIMRSVKDRAAKIEAANAEVSEGGTRDSRIEPAAQSRPSLP